jgi:hypothetical protein
LTVERLVEVKEAVKRDLRRVGLGVGLVSSDTTGMDVRERGDEDEEEEEVSREEQEENLDVKVTVPNGQVGPASPSTDSEGNNNDETAASIEPVKVIRIRSRSLSEASNMNRRPSAAGDEADHLHPEELDTPTYERLLPFAILSPEDPTGRKAAEGESDKVFVRRFKWGQIEVLNPDHCDFTPLRETLLGNNMKVRVFVSPLGVPVLLLSGVCVVGCV